MAPASAEDNEKAAKAQATVNKAVAQRHAENLKAAREKVPREQVLRATEALLQHVKMFREKVREAKGKLQLLEDDPEDERMEATSESSKDFVLVQFALKREKMQKLSFKLYHVPLTHPLRKVDGEQDLCLFAQDKAEAQRWLEQQPVPGIKKVISLHEARTVYHRFKARRELAAMYDVFLADDRILCMLPKALGRPFYSTNKLPLPLRLAQGGVVSGNLEGRVKRALESGFVRYTGTCTSMRAARVAFNAEQITDNVMDAIASGATRMPGGWSNIQAIHIKTGNSAALPVYVSDPDAEDEDEERKESEGEGSSNKADSVEKKSPKRKKPAADTDTEAAAEAEAKAAPSTKKPRKSVAAETPAPSERAAKGKKAHARSETKPRAQRTEAADDAPATKPRAATTRKAKKPKRA